MGSDRLLLTTVSCTRILAFPTVLRPACRQVMGWIRMEDGSVDLI